MTRPTDAAIARAFYSAVAVIKPEHIEGVQAYVSAVIAKAAEFDAESPAGADASIVDAAKAVIRRWDSPLWRQEVGTADLINDLRKAIDNSQEVTTSPERVQIPAESKHVQCPRCPAHMPVGLHCGGPNCPLRK